jgi:hypothetical protein
MTAKQPEPVITSVLSDVHDLPLDSDAEIGADEYSRIMRMISDEDGGRVTTLSGFNSSI